MQTAPLISLDDIRQVAQQLRQYKDQPEVLELPSGTFTVNKLTAEDYDAVQAHLESEDGLLALMGLTEATRDQGVDIVGLLRRAPETAKLMCRLGADGYDGQKKIQIDELALLGAAIFVINFLDNAAIRLFSQGAKGAGLSVSSERSSEPAAAPGGTTE